jgi:hypothetical protein
MSASPIFIHSLFRAGSTYIFEAFRRSASNYQCFQEAMHEIAFFARDNPQILLADHGPEKAAYLRHPDVGGGYFKELFDCWSTWREFISADAVYRGFFAAPGVDDGVSYWKALSEGAVRRPVFQECRSFGRIAALRHAVGGAHVFLWRNPWDQWWSYKVDPYFDCALKLTVTAPGSPSPVLLMRSALRLEELSQGDLLDQFDSVRMRPASSSDSYTMFFMLWCVSLINGLRYSDVILSIDSLSNLLSYRADSVQALAGFGIDNVSFDDCKIPQADFTAEDADFFAPLEEQVFLWLRDGGIDAEIISQLRAFSVQHRKIVEGGCSAELEQAKRARAIARRQEDAVALMSHMIESRLTELKAEIALLEARLQKERERADIAEERCRLAEGRFDRELSQVILNLKHAGSAAEHAFAKVVRVLEANVVDEKARVSVVEGLLREANSQLREAHEQLEVVTRRAEQAEGLANRVEERARQAEAQLQVARTQIEEVTAQADQAQARAIGLESQLTVATGQLAAMTSRAERAEDRLNRLAVELEVAQQELHLVHSANHRHFSELAVAREQLEKLNHANHHHWMLADQRSREIAVLRSSLSWRLTAPLRWLGAFISEKPLTVISAPARTAFRGVTLWAMSQDWLVSAIHRILRPFPRLRDAIRRLVDGATPSPAVAPVSIDGSSARTPAIAQVDSTLGGSPAPLGDPQVSSSKVLGAEAKTVEKCDVNLPNSLLSLSPRAKTIYVDLLKLETTAITKEKM